MKIKISISHVIVYTNRLEWRYARPMKGLYVKTQQASNITKLFIIKIFAKIVKYVLVIFVNII